jgi:hypothetical protein
MTANLTVVLRRHLTILLPAIAVLATSALTTGCSTVENDAAARVNDTELSPEQLTELVGALSGGEVDNGDAIRSTLNIWVLAEVAGAQFVADDLALTDEELAAANTLLDQQLPGFADLSEGARATLVDAQATFSAIDTLSDGQAFVDRATENAEVYVDPRFGQFDAVLGVVPLAVVPSAISPAPQG